jgi:hypothetical protein
MRSAPPIVSIKGNVPVDSQVNMFCAASCFESTAKAAASYAYSEWGIKR